MKDIFLGAITEEVVQYDNSGVVQPGSSKAPVDTSAIDPNTGVVITPNDPNQDREDAPEDTSSNNWIIYLGVGIMAYVLLFKKK